MNIKTTRIVPSYGLNLTLVVISILLFVVFTVNADSFEPIEINSTNKSSQSIVDTDSTLTTGIEPIPCDIKANCTKSHQICMNGFCSCKPNFVLRNGECEKINCLDDWSICSKQDPNRQCESLFGYSHCVCRNNYVADPITSICRPKCVSDQRQMCEKLDSANSLCNIFRCQCKANFRRNSTGQCVPFECEQDSHCWTEGDIYRSCTNGTCTCNYELDPITQRCMINLTSLFKIRYYSSWRTERILLATIIIVPIVFYYCVLQNFRKAKSTIVAFHLPKPGEQFYGSQGVVSIHSPTFITQNKGADFSSVPEGKHFEKLWIEPRKEKNKNIKYQRFS